MSVTIEVLRSNGQHPSTETKLHKAACEQLARTLTGETWVSLISFLQRNSTYFPADRVRITEHELKHQPQTKPTNIGMAILALLGAEKIGHPSDREVDSVLKKIIANLKSLERHEGFFLDWYDSRTGETLTHWPGADGTKENSVRQYLSSIDNAWLALALLIAQKAKPHLAGEIQEILDQMDFEYFFDDRAEEVRGGFDVDVGKFDLFHYPRHLISEPRIITWVNAALKKDPKERRRILSRLLDREGRIPNELAGGAMFEILMPRLFIREKYLDERVRTFVKMHLESGDKWGRSVGDDPNLPDFPYSENGFGGNHPQKDFITSHGIALVLSVFPEIAIKELMRAKEEYDGFYQPGLGFRDSYSHKGRPTETKVFVNEAMVFLSLLNYLENDYFINLFEQHFTEEELNTGCSAAQIEREINRLLTRQ